MTHTRIGITVDYSQYTRSKRAVRKKQKRIWYPMRTWTLNGTETCRHNDSYQLKIKAFRR